MAYSMDLRLKVLEAVDRGGSVRVVADRFGISTDTVRDYRRRRDEHGEPVRLKTGPKEPIKLTPADDEVIHRMIAEDAGVTLNQIRAELNVDVAESTVSRRVRKLGYSLKKSR